MLSGSSDDSCSICCWWLACAKWRDDDIVPALRSHVCLLTSNHHHHLPPPPHADDMSAPASAPSVKMGRIPELLSFIAFFMDNATLASMARVSTVASTPALRMLWSEMDAFGPLLRLLDPALYDPRFLESRKAHYNQFTSVRKFIIGCCRS
jgi:hypothetical protein